MEITQLILASEYTHLIVFLGIMLGGETVLVPAVYLALIGAYDLWLLLAITIVATVIADGFWYWVGRLLPNNKLARIPALKNNQAFIDRFSHFFRNNGLKLLFYSKFVYGTRLVVQILFGVYRRSFWTYLLVDTIGVLAWAGFIFAIGFFVNYGLGSLKDIVFGVQLVFAAFVVIIIALHVWIHRVAKRKWRIEDKEGAAEEEVIEEELEEIEEKAEEEEAASGEQQNNAR